MELRNYQNNAIEICKQLVSNGNKKQNKMIILPCGTGKTEIFKRITDKNILVLTQRSNLRNQTASRFEQESLVIGSGIHLNQEILNQNKSKVVIATVQTLAKDIDNIEKDSFDLIVIDECHHTEHNNLYKKIVEKLDYSLCLGVTATPPKRSQIFSGKDVVYEMTIYEAWEDGWIMMPKTYLYQLNYDFSKLEKKYFNNHSNFSEEDIEEALAKDTHKNFELIFSQAKKISNLERTVVFLSSIALCNKFADFMQKKGIECYAITCKTDKKKNEFYIKRFCEDRKVLLVNVDILSEGIDIPEIETIVMAKVTRNKNKAKQIYGRAMRLCQGKERCNILDFVIESSGYIYSENFITSYFPVETSLLKIPREIVEGCSRIVNEDKNVKKIISKLEKEKINYILSETFHTPKGINTYGFANNYKISESVFKGQCTLDYIDFKTKKMFRYSTIINYQMFLDTNTLVVVYKDNRIPKKYAIKRSSPSECFKCLKDFVENLPQAKYAYRINKERHSLGKAKGNITLAQKNMIVEKGIHSFYSISSEVISGFTERMASNLITCYLIDSNFNDAEFIEMVDV